METVQTTNFPSIGNYSSAVTDKLCAVELHRAGLQTELSTFDLEAENYMVVASKA